MLIAAAVLLGIAALAGLAMAVLHFVGRTPPRAALAGVHGLFAVAGVAVLLLAVIRAGAGAVAIVALVLVLLAALGGLTLLSLHLRGRTLPSGLVAGHGVLALVGFVLLLGAAFALF